tara:strand:+ start:685 stop:1284 length:600 start_codon:yes stop_codon:yes gene_type:complete
MATYNAIKYNVDFGGSSGHLIPIASSTFSNSSGVTFTTLQQTIFDEHLVVVSDFHNDTDNRQCTISFSSDGSNYNRPVTSAFVNASKREDDGVNGSGFNYQDDFSHGDGTGGQEVMVDNANDSDNAAFGIIRLYNLGSSTFVKHYLSEFSGMSSGGGSGDAASHHLASGYINDTSAVTALKFDSNQGTIDGTIQIFGVK